VDEVIDGSTPVVNVWVWKDTITAAILSDILLLTDDLEALYRLTGGPLLDTINSFKILKIIEFF